jgi:putative endonuclease
MTNKAATGKIGEQLATDYFVRRGFEVVQRNYRFRKAEIDLIVRKDDWVIFVEVKTRHSNDFGEPEVFVSRKQMNNIFQAAEEFIYSTDWRGHVRFDILAVKLGEPPEITHFEDALN